MNYKTLPAYRRRQSTPSTAQVVQVSITGTADGFYIGCNILDEDDIYITNLQVLTEQEVLPTGYLVHAM